MRVVTRTEGEEVTDSAMTRGFFGAVKYAAVASFAGVVANATWPYFNRLPTVQKSWLLIAISLAGFANGSEAALTGFERKNRAQQVQEANRKRYEVLYGNGGATEQTKVEAAPEAEQKQ
ncbi:hypothetical protein K493DRAFT_409443 [Basidiobolus meristosporus CBS 931.73]|uniref:HIG1 domain-containing protein n=1 Tax=Basidiobolus meristosporus CBS 931.73 TaxID=1314790 RepID=A0A1Y1XZL2_9FUNG|nr:hypothetical protein K493DRAFT_409443 [Basidiobolus meristosporus CBS 931.73]|eukprot:ORX91200.1 hypothetical protein K493DRAFT_409443 [Basidiobolus meristosporus CBS 931.73]